MMSYLIDPSTYETVPCVTLQGTMHETADLISARLPGGRERRVMFYEPLVEAGEYCESQSFVATFSDPKAGGTREITRQLRAEYKRRGWKYPGAAYRKALKVRG